MSSDRHVQLREVKPGEWYLYWEEGDERPFDWMENSKVYGPFDTWSATEEFLKEFFDTTTGYWTTAYDPKHVLSPTERRLISEAAANKSDLLRTRLRVVNE